jgi:hypothetical protein
MLIAFAAIAGLVLFSAAPVTTSLVVALALAGLFLSHRRAATPLPDGWFCDGSGI